jgi:acetyl esterase/lipase
MLHFEVMNGRHKLVVLTLVLVLLSPGCQPLSTLPTDTPLDTAAPTVTPVVTDYQLIRDVAYGQGGGRQLYLDIYRPLTPIARPTPAVIWIHGGGWSSGDKYPSQVTLLAKAGFFCASINYRLSGEARFPAALEDAKCAVRWLRANAAGYLVDPEAIGVWGGSAGAHLALLVACAGELAGMEGDGGWTGVSSRVQAVCSYYGPTDLVLASGQSSVASFIGPPLSVDPEAYRRASPIYYVDRSDPPLLLVHGDMDSLVPLSQAREMLAEYQKLKLEAQLIVVKNAGHGFVQVGNEPISPSRAEYEQAVLDFFVMHLANR